jgi:hypothetical protein
MLAVAFFPRFMPTSKIYQIHYDDVSRRKLDPGFIPLDNAASSDAQWYEFLPIFNYLNTNQLEDDVWYGFLSPKFNKKFNATSGYVHDFLARIPAETEVALLSPGWDQLCYFQNPWEQAEIWHPGVSDVMRQFLAALGDDTQLEHIVTDVTSSVFSNYVLAKKRYWLEWQALATQLAHFFDSNEALNSQVTYYGSIQNKAQVKAFVQERLATYLLATQNFKVVASTRAKSAPIFEKIFPEGEMVRKALELCDHFKRRYRATRDKTYLNAYLDSRKVIGFRHPYLKK